jgi:dephospho-CoA kinase
MNPDETPQPKSPVVFGLTGGIASGKSFVASLLMKHLIRVVDADQIARDVVEPGEPTLNKIIEAFGSTILKDGRLDRGKLGDIVFADPDKRKQLDDIMKPAIAKASSSSINIHKYLGSSFICYDAALIIEAGLADTYRPLWLVACSPEKQMERLLARGFNREQAEARIKSQLPLEDKIKVADRIIDTNGTRDQTKEQVERLVKELTN